MPKYALLGATGSTGGATLRHLNNSPPEDLTLRIFIRSKSKLVSQQPNIAEKANYSVTEADITDTKALEPVLKNVDAILCCTGSNVMKPGDRLCQDSAQAIIDALSSIRDKEKGSYKAPTVVALSSSSMNEVYTKNQPAIPYAILHWVLHYNYHDLEMAEKLYARAADDGVLKYILAQPGAIMDPDGTEETGHRLSTKADLSSCVSYADLGAAMCELAERGEEFAGQGVGISATGKVKNTFYLQVACLAQGARSRILGW